MSVSILRGLETLWNRRRWVALASVLLAGALALGAWTLARRVVRQSWPQTEGRVEVAGLEETVTVVRDRYGVPHLFAERETDLAFAQGYVHAQDRFWQMEVSRRRARGTLAALLGASATESDVAWRSLGLTSVARELLSEADADALAVLNAYAEGVNAWLASHADRRPFEYRLLEWRGGTPPEPEPWTALDSVLVALALGWQTGGPAVDPTVMAGVRARLGDERAALLLGESPEARGLYPTSGKSPLPPTWALRSRVALVDGEETRSGRPLLAVDLPTDLSLPSPWYVMALRVANKGGEKGEAGATVPGLPGVLVGTVDGARWAGGTLVLPDDLPPWTAWLTAVMFDAGQAVRPGELGQEAGPVDTPGALRAWLLDTYSARAERLISLLVQLQPVGWRQERVTAMLKGWDYHIGENNREGPFFAVFQLELARAAFADELGADLFGAYAAEGDWYQRALDRIAVDPDDPWWDDVTTPERELRGDILRRAYAAALEWIGRHYGDLHMVWEWDLVHQGQLAHPLGDVWPWDQLLSRDLSPDGWADTVNASPGGGLDPDRFYRARAVYGYRQILDLGDPDTLWFLLLPGQSGHPFHPHYADLIDEWLAGAYQPLRLAASPDEVEGGVATLVLTPGE